MDVFTKTYPAPPYDKEEIFRYAGIKGDAREFTGLAEECLGEAEGKLSFRVCYARFPVSVRGDSVDLAFAATRSSALAKNLAGCAFSCVFAATVGIGIDRMIAKYAVLSPAKAVMFQAIGAERIESLCNAFCGDLAREEGCALKPRFSPGYGDLPLALQKDIFRALRCEKNIALTLNESLLMSPSKSVTAIVGFAGKTAAL